MEAVRDDRPVARWCFEDHDSRDGARAADSSPGQPACHGVYRGGVALVDGLPGTGGHAARFNGEAACIEIPVPALRKLEEFTVEFWLKTEQRFDQPFWPASAVIVSAATPGAGSGDWSIHGGSLEPGRNEGRVLFATGPTGGGDHVLASPLGYPLNDGRWHHIVATRTRDGRKRLYVDGKLAAAGTDGGGRVQSNRPLHVGNDRFHAGGRALDGLIDELAIYAHPLSAEQVAAHYAAVSPGLAARKIELKPLLGQDAPLRPPRARHPAGAVHPETSAGWRKHEGNPVFGGGALGTMFDPTVLREADEYWMYVSWRPKRSIALTTSKDGIHWSEPIIVLSPDAVGWARELNRQIVVKRDGRYHMWFTGQAKRSLIGYAVSDDGLRFRLAQLEPVLVPEQPWEKANVMCPHVIWDADQQLYRMWYSGGEKSEPDAIGYATSRDGIRWKKHPDNPIFKPDPANAWERCKVTACQVLRHGGWHLMFYIGFENPSLARIGIARSRDGIRRWQRHPANPIISPGQGAWDASSCYKPFAVFDREKNRWLLWYNGRHRGEQIGLAIHDGEELGWN